MGRDDEIKQLREQNRRLGEQVKLLVRMERRLDKTQRRLEKQVKQVTALNEFSLQATRAQSVEEIVGDALDVLLEIYPFHRALAVVTTTDDGEIRRLDHRPRAGIRRVETIDWSGDFRQLEDYREEPIFADRSASTDDPLDPAVREIIEGLVPDDGAYEQWHRAMLLPLSHRDRGMFGCLWAVNCTAQTPGHEVELTSEDRPMIEVLYRHLAEAVDNLYLRTGLEERVRQRTAELNQTLEDLEETHQKLQSEMADRIEAERALARIQKLESMGQLTASLGHEINNPLTYLLGNLELLDDEIEGSESDDSEARQALDDAVEGAERIAELVRDIRSFAGHDDVELRPVDPADVVDDTVSLVGKKVRHAAALECIVDDQTPRVLANRGLLRQVLVNLVMNAIEACSGDDGDDEVRIEVHPLEDDRVELSVEDTGTGIEPERLDKVFDPFYSTKVSEGGSGLGLFVSHSLIESMGGTITLDSTPGEGTVARVELPVAEAEETQSPTREVAAGNIGPDRRLDILVVDDEEPVLRMLRRGLSNHRVRTTTDGREALEYYENESFDVVICDLMMDGMSGRQLYRRLESMGPDHAGRVVFVTGGAFTTREREFVEEIPNPCLRKPIDRRELAEALAEVVSSTDDGG